MGGVCPKKVQQDTNGFNQQVNINGSPEERESLSKKLEAEKLKHSTELAEIKQRLEADRSKHQEEISSLKQKHENEKRELNRDKSDRNGKTDHQDSHSNALLAELAQSKQELQSTNQKLSKAKEEFDQKLEAEKKSGEQQRAGIEKSNQILSQENQTLKAQVQSLTAELEQTKQQKSEAESQVNALQREIQQLQSKSETLQGKVTDLEKQNQSLKEQQASKPADSAKNQPQAESVPSPKNQISPKLANPLPFSLKDFLVAVNEVRTNPKKFVDWIQTEHLQYIDDRGYNTKNKYMLLKTHEGKAVFKETQEFLKKQAPLQPLKIDAGLTVAAFLHSVYMTEINRLDHSSKDGTGIMERIKKFGSFRGGGGAAENILNRSDYDPIHWTMDFVIDDGVKSRGHRLSIFNKEMALVGFGCHRKDANSEFFYTMDFATSTYASDTSKLSDDLKNRSGVAFYEQSL